MGRPTEIPGKRADQRFTLRVTADLIAFVDSQRGDRSRSKYLRDLVRAEARRQRSN
jgi:hypothetical protein